MELLRWLKGSQRIVYEELQKMLESGEQPSISRLADRVPYCERTVRYALADLRDLGIVSMRQPGPGYPAEYQIHEEECVWFK